jgi:hypothetical protein
MTHSYWLAQAVAVSRWLDSSAAAGATSLERSPGVYTTSAGRPRNEHKVSNVLVVLTRFTSV